jgi:predicted lysophospholipase L1 biosynthesis ABC-type transport system permease subunit
MTRNMGTWDRLVRGLVVAPLAVIASVAVGIGSVLGIILLVVAAIMVATALVGSCPLYRLIGLSTCPVSSRTRSA